MSHPLSGEVQGSGMQAKKNQAKTAPLRLSGFSSKMLSALPVGKYSSPSLCLLSYLKKKAIWCQIHSWHIIKGSTKNVPEKTKSNTTALHMNLIAASHNFTVARSPEIKSLPIHTGRNRGPEPLGHSKRFIVNLLCSKHSRCQR